MLTGGVRETRFAAGLLGGAVLAGVLAFSSPTAAAAAPCDAVLILGARGSGEPSAGDQGDRDGGLGPPVRAAVDALVLELPGTTVDVEAARYPAVPVTALAADALGYLAGLEVGVRWTERRIARSVTRCPSQRIVLVGYSQGAMVMHRVVQDLVASGDDAALARLDGVVLLADGDRDSADGSRRWGSAPRGIGLARQYPGLSGARTVALPASVARRVHSVCVRGDRVCDVTGASGPSTSGGDVHRTRYTASTSAPVRRAIAAVARIVHRASA